MYQIHPVWNSSYSKYPHVDGIPIVNCCQVFMTDPIQTDKIELLKQMWCGGKRTKIFSRENILRKKKIFTAKTENIPGKKVKHSQQKGKHSQQKGKYSQNKKGNILSKKKDNILGKKGKYSRGKEKIKERRLGYSQKARSVRKFDLRDSWKIYWLRKDWEKEKTTKLLY